MEVSIVEKLTFLEPRELSIIVGAFIANVAIRKGFTTFSKV